MLGGVAVLAVLGVLAAVFDLGPFKEAELTRGESIAKGDDICRRAHDAFVDLQTSPPRTASQAAELTGQLIDIASDEADAIGSLNGPPDFEAEVDEYVNAREDGIEAMRDGRAAAEDRDSAAYARSQEEVAASQRERERIARQIGFRGLQPAAQRRRPASPGEIAGPTGTRARRPGGRTRPPSRGWRRRRARGQPGRRAA